MSLRCITWAFHDAPVDNPPELAVLLALADEANDDGAQCWPSIRTIAAKARMSDGGARLAIARLEAAGVVHVSRPARPAPGRVTRYVLSLGRPWEVLEQIAAVESTPTAHLVRSSTARDRASQGAQSRAPRAQSNRAQPRTSAHPMDARNRAQPRTPEVRVPDTQDPDTPSEPLTFDENAERARGVRRGLHREHGAEATHLEVES